ncbi:hypothetical protein RJT34_23601 [Clitoria ternatea]|uniref:Uncharacterized protein n=1 Tax=Clitoria ternatea TaxID=43366 RepID=A0AAN9FMZ3_CLITE
MPGIPAAGCEIRADEPRDGDGAEDLSEEERLAAEESLLLFCKPVELYNILQQRAIRSDPSNEDEPIFTFRGPSRTVGDEYRVHASFMLPEPDKFVMEANCRTLFFLFFASVRNPRSLSAVDASKVPSNAAFDECEIYFNGSLMACKIWLSNGSRAGENCFYASVRLEWVHEFLTRSVKFRSEQLAVVMSGITLSPCTLKYDFLNKGKRISIQDCNSKTENQLPKNQTRRVVISIAAEPFGGSKIFPNHTHANNEEAPSSLSRTIWWKEGHVAFNYRNDDSALYYSSVLITFVLQTILQLLEIFPVHSVSSDVGALEDYPDVNVYVKNDIWAMEIVADGVRPRDQCFNFYVKPGRRREPRSVPHQIENGTSAEVVLEEAHGTGPIIVYPAPDCILPELDKDDHGMEEVPQVGEEGVSDATILQKGKAPMEECEPPISEHENGTLALPQIDNEGKAPMEEEYDPSVSEHENGTLALPQIDNEGKAPMEEEYDPSVSEHENGTLALSQIDNKGKAPMEEESDPSISEHENGTLALSFIDNEGKAPMEEEEYDPPISEHENGTLALSFIDNEGKEPMEEEEYDPPISEHENGTLALSIIDDKGKAPMEEEYDPSISEYENGTLALSVIDNKGKAPMEEEYDPELVDKLKRRQFYHSHTYQYITMMHFTGHAIWPLLPLSSSENKVLLRIFFLCAACAKLFILPSSLSTLLPMSLDEALKDRDSEDEIDEELADFEDRLEALTYTDDTLQKLEFIDGLTPVERKFFAMWNSFVRRQRVLIDGHVNWAYPAFTTLHQAELVQNIPLQWQWRLFMIKLWQLGLLKAENIDKSSLILEAYRKQNPTSK